jgi:hypothetical protein
MQRGLQRDKGAASELCVISWCIRRRRRLRWARRIEVVKEVKRWYDMEQELGLR